YSKGAGFIGLCADFSGAVCGEIHVAMIRDDALGTGWLWRYTREPSGRASRHKKDREVTMIARRTFIKGASVVSSSRLRSGSRTRAGTCSSTSTAEQIIDLPVMRATSP